MLKSMDGAKPYRPKPRGFTLVELLVVISIVAVLAALVTMVANRSIESGRKVQALAQFRDFQVGMTLFETDYLRPPIPQSKRDTAGTRFTAIRAAITPTSSSLPRWPATTRTTLTRVTISPQRR